MLCESMEAGQGPGGRAWFSTVTPDSMESLREKMGPKGTPDRRLSDQRVRELGDTLGRESDYTSQRWPVELAVLGGPPELGDAEPLTEPLLCQTENRSLVFFPS